MSAAIFLSASVCVLHFFGFMIVIVTLGIIRLSVFFDLISLGFSFRPEVTRRL